MRERQLEAFKRTDCAAMCTVLGMLEARSVGSDGDITPSHLVDILHKVRTVAVSISPAVYREWPALCLPRVYVEAMGGFSFCTVAVLPETDVEGFQRSWLRREKERGIVLCRFVKNCITTVCALPRVR